MGAEQDKDKESADTKGVLPLFQPLRRKTLHHLSPCLVRPISFFRLYFSYTQQMHKVPMQNMRSSIFSLQRYAGVFPAKGERPGIGSRRVYLTLPPVGQCLGLWEKNETKFKFGLIQNQFHFMEAKNSAKILFLYIESQYEKFFCSA
jgi:hypothetical protein